MRKAIICFHCRQNIAGKPKMINFIFEGYRFNVFKNGLTCSDCEKRETIIRFQEQGSLFIKLKNGKVCADWDYYSSYVFIRDRDVNILNIILLDLSLLSLTRANNWEVQPGIGFNPWLYGLTYTYFTRKVDAFSYAKRIIGDADCYWSIVQHKNGGRLFTKTQVLKSKLSL